MIGKSAYDKVCKTTYSYRQKQNARLEGGWFHSRCDKNYCPLCFGANLISPPPSEPKAILPESWTSKKVMKAM
jgi:hypothetical protein